MNEKDLTRTLIERTGLATIVEEVLLSNDNTPLIPAEYFSSSPLVFWHDGISMWCLLYAQEDQNDYSRFDPFGNMDDAFLVLHAAIHSQSEQLTILVGELFPLRREGDMINIYAVLGAISVWRPQDICRAIAAAYGVQISDERSKQS